MSREVVLFHLTFTFLSYFKIFIILKELSGQVVAVTGFNCRVGNAKTVKISVWNWQTISSVLIQLMKANSIAQLQVNDANNNERMNVGRGE